MGTYNVHGGHNSIVTGANKYLNEVTEDRAVKNKVISLLRAAEHTVYDCTDDSGRTQSRNLANIVAKCNRHSVDLDISIHLNAGGGTGTEVLYVSSAGEAYAKKISAAIANAFGWRDRGAKKRTNLYVLNHTRAVAVLIECCFVDSQSDAQKWDADKCARAIVQAVTGQAVSDSPSMPSAPSGSTYSGNSIVDYLKSVGKDSSFAARKQYAVQYGISGYTGTAAQNTQLLNAMRGGSGNSGGSSSGTGYYPAFSSTSIVDGLKSIGVDSSFSNRKKIANANGISNYSGTASQNNQLCTLAKKGRLKKA